MAKTKLTEKHLAKIEKLMWERVESALRAGKEIKPEYWWSAYGAQVCAVGAIALNGTKKKQRMEMGGSADVFVLAAKELKKIRIPMAYWGFVLDCISAGFENAYEEGEEENNLGEIARGGGNFTTSGQCRDFLEAKEGIPYSLAKDIENEQKAAERLWNLGHAVRAKYVVKEDETEFFGDE